MVKNILTIVLIFAFQFCLQAKCGCILKVYSSSDTYQSNGVITIELGHYNTSFIEFNILGRSEFILTGNSDKVKLKIVDHFRSTRGREIVILKSIQQLKIGSIYQLSMINVPKEFKNYFGFRYKTTEKLQDYKIIENSKIPIPIPNILINPKLKELSTVQYGCGPARNAVFENPVLFDVDAYIQVELVNMNSFEVQKYVKLSEFLKLHEGNFEIGHGMCWGEFEFEKDVGYKVRFKARNLNWETNGVWSNWVEFDSP